MTTLLKTIWLILLQATLVITKYVEAMDEPLAQTLEKNLGSFQRLLHSVELKSMVPSRLTDYFTLKTKLNLFIDISYST